MALRASRTRFGKGRRRPDVLLARRLPIALYADAGLGGTWGPDPAATACARKGSRPWFGRDFFETCTRFISISGSHTSTASASVGDSSVAASAGATLQQQPTEDDNMATEDLIDLSFTMARELSRSLTDSSAGNSSFENHGAGIFAHGALGIVVQITDKIGQRGRP